MGTGCSSEAKHKQPSAVPNRRQSLPVISAKHAPHNRRQSLPDFVGRRPKSAAVDVAKQVMDAKKVQEANREKMSAMFTRAVKEVFMDSAYERFSLRDKINIVANKVTELSARDLRGPDKFLYEGFVTCIQAAAESSAKNHKNKPAQKLSEVSKVMRRELAEIVSDNIMQEGRDGIFIAAQDAQYIKSHLESALRVLEKKDSKLVLPKLNPQEGEIATESSSAASSKFSLPPFHSLSKSSTHESRSRASAPAVGDDLSVNSKGSSRSVKSAPEISHLDLSLEIELPLILGASSSAKSSELLSPARELLTAAISTSLPVISSASKPQPSLAVPSASIRPRSNSLSVPGEEIHFGQRRYSLDNAPKPSAAKRLLLAPINLQDVGNARS